MFERTFSNIGYSLLGRSCENTVSISHSSDHADFEVTLHKFFNNPDLSLKYIEKIGEFSFQRNDELSNFTISPVFNSFFKPQFSLISFNPSEKMKFVSILPISINSFKVRVNTSFQQDEKTHFELGTKWKDDLFEIKTKVQLFPILETKLFFEIGKSAILSKFVKDEYSHMFFLNKGKVMLAIGPYSVYGAFWQENQTQKMKIGMVHESKFDQYGISYDVNKKAVKLKTYISIFNGLKFGSMIRYSHKEPTRYLVGAKVRTELGKCYFSGALYKSLLVGIKTKLTDSISVFGAGKVLLSNPHKTSFRYDIVFDH